MGKPTAAAMELRVQQVIRWVCAGLNAKQITDLCGNAPGDGPAAGFGVSKTQASVLLARARELIRHASIGERAYHINLGLMRCEDVYRKAMAAGDFKGALAAERQRAKLVGLDTPFTVADLERLVKMRELIAGRATDRLAVSPEPAAESPPADPPPPADPMTLLRELDQHPASQN